MEKDDDMASPDGMPDEPRTNSRVFTYLIVIAEVICRQIYHRCV